MIVYSRTTVSYTHLDVYKRQRQLYEILVPGGRRFTPGASESATASLPINKIDMFGPFFALGWTY